FSDNPVQHRVVLFGFCCHYTQVLHPVGVPGYFKVFSQDVLSIQLKRPAPGTNYRRARAEDR
ncbi:MAG: hypothetical protein WCE46_10850, partial [Methanoregula sp.]|uniref:hypothetical protein n=1 Tax=Methanoregula sp. TaxID=2052170 RepID=UPI003C715BB3